MSCGTCDGRTRSREENQGNLDIEHEDEVFAGAALALIEGEADIVEMLGREPNGLILGFKYLRQLIPPVAATELLPR